MRRIFWAALAALFVCSGAWAQGSRYTGQVIRSTAAIGGASVRVCTEAATGTPCTPLASIYSDKALTVLDADSIIAADSQGNYGYWAAPGCYKEQISGAGFSNYTQTVCQGPQSIQTNAQTVSFSATPTFNLNSGSFIRMTLTGNVTSSSVSNASTGSIAYFNICQDATGNRTFAWPTSFLTPPTVGTPASSCTSASFIYDGTNWRELDDVQRCPVGAICVDGVKYATIQAAHDSFGATCGEIVVRSNLSLSGTTTLSKPGCKLNLGAVTLTFAAGAQLAITGADSEVYGLGDKTLLDASAGTSATSSVYVSSAASRAYLHDFKVTGNRVAGGTAYAVQIGDASGVVDSVKVERVTSQNSGSIGIYAVKTTNFQAKWNRIITPKLSGIGIDTSSNHTRLKDNYIEDSNPGATAAHSGISAFSQVTLAHLDLIVSGNTVAFTGTGDRAGMELDSVDGLQVLNNRVVGSHTAGEGIAFTATRALVHGNYVSDGSNGGILCYLTALASSDLIISNNTAINNTTYGIAVMWGANSLTASNILLSTNRGAAIGGTQSIAIQLIHDSGKTGGVIGSGFILEANDGFGSGAGGPVNIDGTLTGKPTLNDYASNTSGLKDVPSGFIYRFVNNAGSGYINALQKDASDIVQIGDTAGTRIGGVVKGVNGIATVANGVPAEYAVVDLTAQTAAVGTTTLYAVPASGAGQYRLSWNAKVTTAATTGAATSTLGALTIVYTDPDGVVQTITAPASIAAGTIATSSTGNTTTTVLLGMPLLLNCKLSTNITYAMAYASDTANQMAYNLHLVLEKQ